MLNTERELKHSKSLLEELSLLLSVLFFVSILSGCKNIFSGGGADGQSDANTGFAPGLDPLPTEFAIIDLNPGSAFTAATVSWQPSQFSENYVLMYREVGSQEFIKIPNVTSPYTVSGLTKNKRYQFQVQASNNRGITLTATRVISLVSAGVRTGNFVSSTSQLKRTASGKVFQGAIAEFASEIKTTTTANGYKVYSNIQGQLLPGTGGSQ